MSMPEALTAIRQRADTNWTATPICHYGEAFDPPSQKPWVLMERDAIPASVSSSYGSAGKRVVQDPGIIIGTVYWPKHGGVDGAYALAAAFGELFRTQKIGPAQTDAPTMGPVDDGDDDGNWIRIAVSIPFSVSYFA